MPFHFCAHLSWTTWARLPLIDETVAKFLGPFLLAEAKRHGARVMEMGIVRDHVHLLLELPPVYDAPRLVQSLKGAIQGGEASAGRRATTFAQWGSDNYQASRHTSAIKN